MGPNFIVLYHSLRILLVSNLLALYDTTPIRDRTRRFPKQKDNLDYQVLCGYFHHSPVYAMISHIENELWVRVDRSRTFGMAAKTDDLYPP